MIGAGLFFNSKSTPEKLIFKSPIAKFLGFITFAIRCKRE